MRHSGPVFACRVKGVPSPWLNRVIGLAEANADAVADIAAWFVEAGIAPRYETTPDSAGPTLAHALAATGALPTDGDTLVWGTGRGGAMPPAISRAEDEAAVETFLDTHLAGLGIPLPVHDGAKSNMRGWRGLPDLTLLIAWHGAEPAGTCVLHRQPGQTYIADMATLPAHRHRGVQVRLLAAAHALHGESGIVWARCRFLSQSHRNLQRAGLATLCTTSFWT
jgi:GNAT superfamily N-acetyltransferase